MQKNNYVYVFNTEYYYKDENNDTHSFHIGYFSSNKKAREIIEKISDKPGFRDKNGEFIISRERVYFDNPNFQKRDCVLFLLAHEFLDDDGYDNTTIWGPFETRTEAEDVYLENKDKKPYCLYPDNFWVYDTKVDLYGWSEGFI